MKEDALSNRRESEGIRRKRRAACSGAKTDVPKEEVVNKNAATKEKKAESPSQLPRKALRLVRLLLQKFDRFRESLDHPAVLSTPHYCKKRAQISARK